MRNYIDESGTFCWTPQGLSVFAGLSIAGRSLPRIEDLFLYWKSKALNLPDGTEVKGSALTREQLGVFVKWVVLPQRDFWVTGVGFNTSLTKEGVVRTFVEQAAEVCEAASRYAATNGDELGARRYRQFAAWLRRRSPQNGLWLYALSRCVLQTMQHSVVRHPDEPDDPEFEDWEIVIDKTTVVEKPRHERFWGSWLQNRIYQETTQRPFDIPNTWVARNHPFVRKYVRGDVARVTDILRHQTRFADSTAYSGLQMADVCATILRRRHSDNWFEPFDLLEPRIVYEKGKSPLLVLHLDESALRKGPPEDSLKFLDAASVEGLPEGGDDGANDLSEEHLPDRSQPE